MEEMIEVFWEKDNLPHRDTMAMWNEHPYCTPVNPGRKRTKAELEACPKIFTCFCCLEKHPKKKLGGRYHEKWFCVFCVPFVDEWTAGAMVWWDERRRKRHFGKPSKRTKPLTKAERKTLVRSAVVWCITHGYPIKSKEIEKGGSDNDR
jgi:hypothetical protein